MNVVNEPTTPVGSAHVDLNTTPPKAKHLGDRFKHDGHENARDSCLGHAQIGAVENFEAHYLRAGELDPKRMREWTKFKNDMMKQIASCKIETRMYPFIVRLLTKICLFACEGVSDTDRCLAFVAVGSSGCLSSFEGSKLRPDIVAIWVTRKEAKQIVRDQGAPHIIYWWQIVSIVEIKNGSLEMPSSVQTGTYLHVLPRGLPNLAGMLYLHWDLQKLYIYWSDTSGIIRSHSYWFDNDGSWEVLSNFVRTLARPLPGLATRDPTMSISLAADKSLPPRWKIASRGKTFKTSLLFASNAHSRQTCIFWDKVAKRIIKDHWRDNARRFNEIDILEKIKGVPGVVQVDYSEVVSYNAESDEVQELVTSDLHSGPDRTLDIGDRFVPQRTKQRSVLKSSGDPLSCRKSVRQVLGALYDSIQGHQICLVERRTLHRDVSRNNIIIEPEHHDVKLDDIPGAKFLRQVLNPSETVIKEEGVLIDWDNAANLDEVRKKSAPLTGRTGTPIFIAAAVATGKIQTHRNTRPKFPELTGKAKDLYVRAYGQETYDKYIEVVNATDDMKNVNKRVVMPKYCHAAYHDMESFYWVLVHELVLAWPEKEEKALSVIAAMLIDALKTHSFVKGGDDSRNVGDHDVAYWEDVLHPRLKIVATMVQKIEAYVGAEWALWEGDNLPEDHCHEAVKRILFEAIVLLEELGDPIPLRANERLPEKHPEALRGSSYMESFETVSPRKRHTKRSYREQDASTIDEEDLPNKKVKNATPESLQGSSRLSTGTRKSKTSAHESGNKESLSSRFMKAVKRGRLSHTKEPSSPPPSSARHRSQSTRSTRSSKAELVALPSPELAQSTDSASTGQSTSTRRSLRIRQNLLEKP